ncbi:hypothetical protein BJ878DRAFT_532563 [Calycina marina]|uniref:Uncharacterized protein n=1 Tax=Calycina marina TaxID=1763456 RepID=A0A9P8CHM5_9HELO|nr:hypothetical protein BJ878DRAFT_532563 [Calycina marina]
MPSSRGTNSRPPSPTLSKLPSIPSSPTYSYASTANPIPSSFGLPNPPTPHPVHAVLTKSDLELSQAAYEGLLISAKAYRLALSALSTASSTFGSSLETCARLKEARSDSLHGSAGNLSNSFTAQGNCTADGLLAASGVHQLIANHQQILSEVVYRSFEVPLLHEMDTWQRKVEEEEVTYKASAKAMSKEIQRLEKDGLKVYKQRKRDVSKFREHLVNLTVKLDGLTSLHGAHARGLLRDCQETSTKIVECGAGLVRAEVDIFEALARKGWSGGGLEELLEKGKDHFANDDTPRTISSADELFSILPPKSILVDSEAGQASDEIGRSYGRADSLGFVPDRFQSLAGAMRDGETASIWSEQGTSSTTGLLNRSRGARAFSPTPVTRISDPGPLTGSVAENVTVRERRWSVTDDDVV